MSLFINFWDSSNRALNGVFSACQWWSKLNNPKLGLKNATIEATFLMAANPAQVPTASFGLNRKNPFSSLTTLMLLKIVDSKLNVKEIVINLVGLTGSPRNVSFWKKLSNPAVVGVRVCDNKRRMICKQAWLMASSPKLET